MRGVTKHAESLFNGVPSCRECKKNKSILNFVAKSKTGNSHVIVTQIASKTREVAPAITTKDEPFK